MKNIYILIILYFFTFLENNYAQNFQWADAMGGANEDNGTSIAVDGVGNVYTTGYFQDSADFDPGTGVFKLYSAGYKDIFVSKVDASGNFLWAKSLGGIYDDRSNSITVDLLGNVYVTGAFDATVDFDPGAAVNNISSSGSTDIFIVKLDANGNFIWAKAIGSGGTESGYSIKVDENANVYTIGTFEGTVDFDPGVGTYNITSVGSSTDIFVSKLDASGNFIWAKTMGGALTDIGISVAIDGIGNIYTAGFFYSATADFDPDTGTFNLTSAGGSDIFVSKLNSSGNFIWAKSLGGTTSDYSTSITLDESNNVYTTGYFGGTADFDPGTGIFNLTPAGNIDIFVSKLDASGNFLWAKAMGGTSNDVGNSIAFSGNGYVLTTGYFYTTADFDPGSGTFNLTADAATDMFLSTLDTSGNFISAKAIGAEVGYSIAVDGTWNVYLTGQFGNPTDFDPDTSTFTLTSAGNYDVFVTKFDGSGEKILRAKTMGGTSDDRGYSIKVDEMGNIYTTGFFQGTADFDPGAGTFNLTSASAGYVDIFLTKLDAFGNFLWAKAMGGAFVDLGQSLVLDKDGNAYLTGYFSGTSDFDPGSGTFNLTSAGNEDIFICKLNTSGNFIWAKALSGTSSEWSYSIVIDEDENIYTTGAFNGIVDFDPGSGTFNLSSTGNFDIFISKLDSSGNFIWAKAMGGVSNDWSYSIDLDKNGNIYTTGYFTGTADFDPGSGTFNLTSAGIEDVFICKLNTSGNFIWVKTIGGIGFEKSYSIAVDKNGYIYTSGFFDGTADFDPGSGTFNLNPVGNWDIFVSKLDTSGDFIWAKSMGGTSSDICYSIATDKRGNVYTTGYFTGMADFDPSTDVFYLTATGISYDIFVSKLDASGNFLWAKGMNCTNYGYGYSVAVDENRNVYTTGTFSGTTDFDPEPESYKISSFGTGDVFISKLTMCNIANTTAAATICLGDSILLQGIYQTTAGVYYDTIESALGCDSVVITTLIVNQSYNIVDSTMSICSGDSVPIYGIYRFLPGIYYDSLTTITGCDSIHSTSLAVTVLTLLSFTTDATCNLANGKAASTVFGGNSPYIYSWSNGAIADSIASVSPGTYTLTVTDNNGCNSTMSVNIADLSSPVVNLGNDTVICTSAVMLDANNPGDSYLWSTGDITQAIIVVDTGTYFVVVTDTNGCTGNDTILLSLENGCDSVWPGSIDLDFIVNQFDLLSIGLAYGDSGIARDTTSIDWQGFPALDWNDTLKNGLNKKFVDCNGDGVINYSDVLAIIGNFNKTHSKTSNANQYNAANPDLYFEVLTSNIVPGSSVEVAVMAGKDSISLYGIAFDLKINMSFIEPNSLSIHFENSWLGTDSVDMIKIGLVNDSIGEVYAGSVRTNGINKADSGLIATLIFVVDSAITNQQIIPLEIQGVGGVSYTGDTITFNNDKDTVTVKPLGVSKIISDTENLKIYPNPFKGVTNIEYNLTHKTNVQIEVYNMLGEKISTIVNTTQEQGSYLYNYSAKKSNHVSGVYVLKVKMNGNIITKRLMEY